LAEFAIALLVDAFLWAISILNLFLPEIIDLPFTAFDKFYPFDETFRQIQKVEIRGRFAENQSGSISAPSVSFKEFKAGKVLAEEKT
jgi:hypothetical protein